MTYTYYPKGVCTSKYEIEIEDGIVKDLRIERGCDGNLQGITRLVKGNEAEKMALLLRGVRCGDKTTSCPDQIAIALENAMKKERRESDGV